MTEDTPDTPEDTPDSTKKLRIWIGVLAVSLASVLVVLGVTLSGGNSEPTPAELEMECVKAGSTWRDRNTYADDPFCDGSDIPRASIACLQGGGTWGYGGCRHD